LLEVSVDREDLERSYDEWLGAIPSRISEIEDAGLKPHKIDVSIAELIAWCQSQGRVVDGAARAEYVAHKVRQLRARSASGDAGA